jgi:hypothetical protein
MIIALPTNDGAEDAISKLRRKDDSLKSRGWYPQTNPPYFATNHSAELFTFAIDYGKGKITTRRCD